MALENGEIQEELFCLRYELKSLSDALNYGLKERWMPGFSNKSLEDSHVKRYKWVLPFVKDKTVLDIASGSGRGAWMIAVEGMAKSVCGVDIDKDSIRYAKHRHAYPAIEFLQGDATSFVDKNKFDIIISFETVEHLPQVENYFQNIRDSLKENGIFYVSTPISQIEMDDRPKNKFHVREWGYRAFQNEVARYFSIEQVHLQLYPYISNNLFNRFGRYAGRRLGNFTDHPYVTTIYSEDDVKKQFAISSLGNELTGYQILVCKKS